MVQVIYYYRWSCCWSVILIWCLLQISCWCSHSDVVNTADGFGHLRWKIHNDRAFAVAAPNLWNTLLVNIESLLKTLNLCLKLSFSCWFWIHAEFDNSLFTYVCIHYAFIVLCFIYICYFVLCFRPVLGLFKACAVNWGCCECAI